MSLKYLVFKHKVIPLHKGEDGFWKDIDGTIYAFSDDTYSVDPVKRCGIGSISLPENSPLNAGCDGHEYMYSSPVFQMFHTRKEADEWLKQSLDILSKNKWYSFVPRLFSNLASWFGGKYWENKTTR